VSWTDERILQLRELWDKGMTASEIADQLGSVSRNAVIGKAHRLGLQSRPLEPLGAVKGASVPAADLVRYRWRNGPRYLHADCNRVIHAACALAAARAQVRTPYVTAHDLIDALSALTRYVSSSSSAGRMGKHFADVDISPATDALGVVDNLAIPPHDKAVEASILRWDVVEIFQSAARIRARTGDPKAPIDLRHMVCGLVLTTAGHLGFSDAGLWSAGFQRLQRLALGIVRDPDLAPSKPSHPEWRHIENEIQSQSPLGFVTQSHADYTSDRVVAGRDALGTTGDARALANLILLEAAEPPLAIAVFGAWGSGKSTLLAELRQEVHRQTQEERDRIAAGGAKLADQPGRVSGIIQVDFNAWTFADSQNLWASMTAELFDQIAAGGHDQNVAQHGARLVKEVADRSGHETETRRNAEAQLRASENNIAIAKVSIARNSQSRASGLVEASAQALLELFGPAKEAAAGTAKKGGNSGRDGALAPFRKAILADTEAEPDAKARAYVEASGPVSRFMLLLWDYARDGAGLRRWLLLASGVVLSLLIVAWLQGRLPLAAPTWPGWARWIAPSLPMLASIAALVLPAIRATAIFGKVIAETKQRLRQEGADAQVKLEEGLQAQREAQQALETADDFLRRYAGLAESAAPPPALMLDYLLSESADVTSIKGKMGFLGIVRRCFDQLNAVVESSRARDPNSPVQRIIIYIDDLDRCSERQVVQVLEAIHLLLAYPCFVVVAAVDARWLEHALLSEHRALAEGNVATPADYLEKIFQVPFWVRPLDRGHSAISGYRRYVSELLGIRQRTDVVDEKADIAIRAGEGGEQQTLRRLPPFVPETRGVGLTQRLILTDQEKDLLLALGVLAAKSPRAVKRMVNIYRLIRVSIDAWDDQRGLLGQTPGTPSFYSVQLLLACEVGLPVSVMSALAGAIATMSNDEWITFVMAVRERQVLTGPIVRTLGSSTNLSRFTQGIDAVASLADVPSAEDMRLALAVIGRFSFRSNASS
jgi:hypothetical protein